MNKIYLIVGINDWRRPSVELISTNRKTQLYHTTNKAHIPKNQFCERPDLKSLCMVLEKHN